jgi:hypothetical protein
VVDVEVSLGMLRLAPQARVGVTLKDSIAVHLQSIARPPLRLRTRHRGARNGRAAASCWIVRIRQRMPRASDLVLARQDYSPAVDTKA